MRTLLLVLAVSTGALAAPSPQVLIGGGGEDVSDAERWLADFQQTLGDPAFGKLVTLAEGFPKIVESATVEGLKPGLHVVLLGFCSNDDAAARVAALRMIDAGVYQRATPKLPEKTCPTVNAFPPPGEASWKEDEKVEHDARTTLVAWVQQRSGSAAREVVVRLLVEGKLADAQRVAPLTGGDTMVIGASCTPSVSLDAKAKALVVEQSCNVDVRGNAAACWFTSSGTLTFSVDAQGKLKVKRSKVRLGKTQCGGE